MFSCHIGWDYCRVLSKDGLVVPHNGRTVTASQSRLTTENWSGMILLLGWSDERGPEKSGARKVRTPQSGMPGNSRSGETCWIGPQKQTTQAIGMGEKAV